ALGRLVEDEQLGLVLDGLDDPELLAHPTRVLADRPGEIGPRQLEQVERAAATGDLPTAERPQMIEQIDAAHAVVEARAARQVADPGTLRDPVDPRIATEHA